MNVLEFYKATFPKAATTADEDRDMKSMPIDSNCGSDCFDAIQAAKTFHQHVVMAFGENKAAEDVAYMAKRVILCYICG